MVAVACLLPALMTRRTPPRCDDDDDDGWCVCLVSSAAIRRIMKLDPEVKTVAKDAALLVAKATVRPPKSADLASIHPSPPSWACVWAE